MIDIEHLKNLKEGALKSIEMYERKYSHDKYRHYYSSMYGTLKTLAIAKYWVDQDVPSFRENMKKSAEMRLALIRGYDNGERVSVAYATMLAYHYLFNALCSGDIAFAKEFASHMAERGKGKSEAGILKIDNILGHALKCLVLEEEKKAREWTQKLDEECQKKHASYRGLVKILKGILDKDSVLTQTGFDEFKKGYRMLTRRGDYGDHSQWLNKWGIGLANLAISRGLKLEINDEYIPKDLLIESIKS